MSIAFSEGPIFYNTIRGDSIANFLTDFLAAAISVDWSYTSITDGYMFQCTSKQLLSAKLKVWDEGNLGTPLINLQWQSTDGTYIGYKHQLPMDGNYKAHLNNCQYFIAQPTEAFNKAAQGGIPFVPDASATGDCAVDIFPTVTPNLVNQAFWSCGSDGQQGNNFRYSHYAYLSWSALINNDLMNSATETFEIRNRLRIIPVTIAAGIPTNFWSDIIQRTRHFTPDNSLFSLAFDPILVWGRPTDASSNGRIRGLVYDAFQPSLDTSLDQLLINVFGTDWVNYMHDPQVRAIGTRFGSLALALRQPSPASSSFDQGAYIY